MKLTITIEGDFAPDALAKFLRSATPVSEAPAPAKNRQRALDKLRAQQSLHGQPAVYTAQELDQLRGNASRMTLAYCESKDAAS